MDSLFGNKFYPKDERDLARYILNTHPETRDSVDLFTIACINHLLDRDLTPDEMRRIKLYNPINGNRRRQELQNDLKEMTPNEKEKIRRTIIARI